MYNATDSTDKCWVQNTEVISRCSDNG